MSGLFLFQIGASTPAAVAVVGSAEQSSIISFGSLTYTFNEGSGAGTIVLRIEPPSSVPVTVTVASANMQAEAPADFEALRQSLVIAANVPAYTLTLSLIDDDLVETDEQMRLALGGYQGVSGGAISETVVTIQDNDIAYLTIHDVAVNEPEGSVSLIISQSLISTLDSEIDVRTVEGSATSPEDYTSLLTTAVIPAGRDSTTITVPLEDDDEIEAPESFAVVLERPVNAQLINMMANMTATVTINDDDRLPELSALPAVASESDGVLSFVVTLSAAWPQTVTVEYVTLDSSALASQDYIAQTGILTFTPGSTTARVEVTLLEDQLIEPDETIFLLLSKPSGATLFSGQIQGIIHDGDSFSGQTFLPGLRR